jgi:hypothetical protein
MKRMFTDFQMGNEVVGQTMNPCQSVSSVKIRVLHDISALLSALALGTYHSDSRPTSRLELRFSDQKETL